MRRWMKMFLLGSLFAVLLCGSTLAAETVTGAGFYDVTSDGGLTVTAGASSGMVQKVSADVDSDSTYETFHVGSDKLDVTVSGTSSGNQYLVLLVEGDSLPTADSQVYYIDQAAAAGDKVEFTVLPKLPTSGATQMTLFVTSDDGKATKSVALGYANGSNFPVAPYKLGDVDNNGSITAGDALAALRMSVGLGTWTETQRLAAKVNLNSTTVTAGDALMILRASVGLISLG